MGEFKQTTLKSHRILRIPIVGWNYLYLARELDRQPDEAHREDLINAIRNGSVTA